MLKGAGTARVALDRMARVFIEPLKCFKKQTEWYRYGAIGDFTSICGAGGRSATRVGVFGQGAYTLADAILDRIVHNSHRLELGGESMRKIEAEKTEKQAPKKEKTGGN